MVVPDDGVSPELGRRSWKSREYCDFEVAGASDAESIATAARRLRLHPRADIIEISRSSRETETFGNRILLAELEGVY
jgi:hypothetical protein